MKNVVAYCRVSTEKESQFSSFEAQKQFFVDYAKKNDLNLLRIYADGTSTKERAEFNEMMQDSEKGIFDCVLVKDVSGLARNVVALLNCIRDLTDRDINIKLISPDMNTLNNDFMLLTIQLLAQEFTG